MLLINAEGLCGDDIVDVVSDMVALAERLGVVVRVDINGVDMLASPGDSVAALISEFQRRMK